MLTGLLRPVVALRKGHGGNKATNFSERILI